MQGNIIFTVRLSSQHFRSFRFGLFHYHNVWVARPRVLVHHAHARQ